VNGETGKINEIARYLRTVIRSLTAEDAYYNPRKSEGNQSDYSHVAMQLRQLLDMGYADAVLDLGEELWRRGNKQLEYSYGEEETAKEISSCLEIVVQALPDISLSRAQQLLWLIDHEMDDDYGLLDGLDELVRDSRFREEDWREVASILEERLQGMSQPRPGAYSATFRREQITTWLCTAYRRSGQQQKVVPLLEQEADSCRNYEILVKTLLEIGERDRAHHWCVQGFAKTIKDAPSIAKNLRDILCQLAEKEGEFKLAAAYRAEDFFDYPSVKCYEELRKATEKIDVWGSVRTAILDLLHTGIYPAADENNEKSWPLPKLEVGQRRTRGEDDTNPFPLRELLIDIAILEKRHDDAVAMYDELNSIKRWSWHIDERLATAVADSHPDVALQIWKSIADRLMGEDKPEAYQNAAGYLTLMRKLYERNGRLADWKTMIDGLRVEHKPKQRLIEVLDSLE